MDDADLDVFISPTSTNEDIHCGSISFPCNRVNTALKCRQLSEIEGAFISLLPPNHTKDRNVIEIGKKEVLIKTLNHCENITFSSVIFSILPLSYLPNDYKLNRVCHT